MPGLLEPDGRPHHWPYRGAAPLSRFRRLFGLLNAVRALYPTTGETLIRFPEALSAGGYEDADED